MKRISYRRRDGREDSKLDVERTETRRGKEEKKGKAHGLDSLLKVVEELQ